MKNESKQPAEEFLSRFPALRSRDLDESRDLICRIYQEVRLDMRPGLQGFHLSMNVKPLRWLRLSFAQAPFEFTTSTLEPMKIHSFDVVTSGSYGYRSSADRLLADNRQVVVASGENPFDVIARSRSHLLSAIIDHDDLDDLASIWIGHKPRKPLRFARVHSYRRSQVASFASMVKFLAREVNRPGGLLDAPAALASMEEAVIKAVIFGMENNFRDALSRSAPDAGSNMVRRLEEYLEAYAAEPLNMTTIAKETGYSVRSIYRAFRRNRNYSPMQFLRKVRMQIARKRFLNPLPNDNVSLISMECGFPHLGRFSQEYFTRFGESPSATLYRTRQAG